MQRRLVVQIRFAQAGGETRPVAALVKHGGAGARVTVEVEGHALQAGLVHVLYRAGAGPGVVVAGSVHRDRVEAARQALGDAWRIASIPLELSRSSA